MKGWVKDVLTILVALAFFVVLGFTEWRMYRLGYADGWNAGIQSYTDCLSKAHTDTECIQCDQKHNVKGD